jgi:hypothetical protein
VGWEQRARATSSNIFQRQLGQAIGTALFGAVFNLGFYRRIPDAQDAVSRMMIASTRAALPPLEAARDANAMALALHPIFLLLGVAALALLACALALPAKLRPDNHPPTAQR